MASALSPREIQARIRGGASVEDVAVEAGVEVERIRGFAGPVLAERDHMTHTALASSVRRRGDGTGHRHLGDIIADRLGARGLDSDQITWDSWRRGDQKWVLVGEMTDGAASRRAEFLFDPRARFSVTSNADARWMIGEELAGTSEPDNENTVDLDDEFALVRATLKPYPQASSDPGTAPQESLYDDTPQTSELDDLYDLMGGLSEDSVRIYIGLEDIPAKAEEAATAPVADAGSATTGPDVPHAAPKPRTQPAAAAPEALIEAPGPDPAAGAPKPKSPKRRRAKVPTWDEIMFGGGRDA